ncbi:ATP-binding cassette domain-containing protein [Klebsiella pneumoniae]|uniref:ATP-binding cassette domain-containing protein n=1 Tax=Klebsiella pneumoniae TaxID=573 RepID=A0A939NMD5_KLEPN|nr:ATP-binding cassette domain-containing protein [Klebsiella pneumoniae]
MALLGRSGCGKRHRRGCWWVWKRRSTVILRRGAPLTALKGEAIGAFRRDIQLVFQDAFSAVNPRKTVREIVSEPLRHLLCLSREARARRVEEMLLAVDLAPSLLDKRPAQLSGGQLQRVCPARATAVRPQLLILMKRFQISICCCRRRLSPC